MGNFSDQNSRQKLFYPSYSFSKQFAEKSKHIGLNINSMPALQKLLGYVLKVG